MSNRLNYTRKFIIFKKDYSNMAALKAKGHGKLELKGNNLQFSLNIQGAEASNFYNIELVKGKESKIIGKIYTKEDKSGSANLDINYKDLQKTGFSLEKIDGIILIREASVLLGESLIKNTHLLRNYIENIELNSPEVIHEDQGLLEEVLEEESQEVEENSDIEEEFNAGEKAYIEEEPDIEEETHIEERTYPDQDPILEAEFTPIEENIPIEYIEEVQVTPEEVQEIYERVPSEEDILEDRGEVKEEDFTEENLKEEDSEDMFCETKYKEIMEEMFNIPELGYENNTIADEDKEEKQKSGVTDYILNILNFFPYSEPFALTLEGYNWWKIDIEDPELDKSFLPYFNYIVDAKDQTSRFEKEVNPKELLKKYGHYIFGLYNEDDNVKFYVYGIPGSFSLDEHPKQGNTGFNTWFEGVELPGYWLLYIEPETGRILYPINPMIPKS